jgi:amidase/aspartyl-tRNA(Asn)/glutamyl-tRNA(Gln) amidotransferase subunit A
VLVHEILAARTVTRSPAGLAQYRLAVPRRTMLDGLDSPVARAFERSLSRLRSAGARIEEIELAEIADLGTIQANGGFAAAESYAWHRALLARHRSQYDPRVAARIERGAAISAADYIDLLQARTRWISALEAGLRGFDAALSPTVPMVAPAIASIASDDAEFFRVNALLLRNTSVVNMLDGCAISLPCQDSGELPVGLMLWHGALHDDNLLNLALQVEQALRPS